MHPHEQIGPYILTHQTGRSALADGIKTYAAQHQTNFQNFTVQFVSNPTHIQYLVTSATLLHALNHPCIIRCFEHGAGNLVRQNGTVLPGYYAVLEPLANQDLLEIIMNHTLNEPTVCYLFEKIAGAVEYLHQQGYAHRDIKPESIGFTPQGDVKLMGFELVVPLGPGGNITGGAGTMGYMAPETSAPAYSGAVADAFSLGVTLFAMALRCCPFTSAKPSDTHFQLLYMGNYVAYWALFAAANPVFTQNADFKNLIQGLLNAMPANRMAVAQALASNWVMNTAKPNDATVKALLTGYFH